MPEILWLRFSIHGVNKITTDRPRQAGMGQKIRPDVKRYET